MRQNAPLKSPMCNSWTISRSVKLNSSAFPFANLQLLLLVCHYFCMADFEYLIDTKFLKQSSALKVKLWYVACGLMGPQRKAVYLWVHLSSAECFMSVELSFLLFCPFSFPEYMCSRDVSCRRSFHWWQFNLKHLSCLWAITCSCSRPWKKNWRRWNRWLSIRALKRGFT